MTANRPASPASVASSASQPRTVGRTAATDILAAHPLLATGEPTSVSPVPYPVYTGRGAAHPASPGARQPGSPSHLPPLVSRPSDSQLPAPSTISRSYARSISEASEKLKGQNLRSELHLLGLAGDSVGAALVHKLSTLAGDTREWDQILAAVASAKVTMLLPAERLASPSLLTPAFFLDHLALLDIQSAVASTSRAIVDPVRGFCTLSGLRGTINSESIVVSSGGSALVDTPNGLLKTAASISSPVLTDLVLHSAIRGSAVASGALSPTSTPYPSFKIVSSVTDLSIPRPTVRASNPAQSIGRVAGSTGSRLAALFSKVPAPESTPSALLPASEITSSRSTAPNLEVQILAIDRMLRRSELVKQVARTLDMQVREALKGLDGSEGEVDVADQLCSFVARFQPPPSWSSCFPPPRKSLVHVLRDDSLYASDVDEISDAFQDVMHAARLDLARNICAVPVKDKRRQRKGSEGSQSDNDVDELDPALVEDRVDVSLEHIERILTVSLYDRIFSCPASGDAAEDEALASRIAALNIMDLSLDHLGLDLGGAGGSDGWDASGRTVRDSLEEIVGHAGKELERLQGPKIRTPRDKLSVLVNVHKIIVEGLSGLPPIPIRSDTSMPNGVAARGDVEMNEAASRSSSLKSTSRPTSVRTGTQAPEGEELRTHRPTKADETTREVPAIHLPQPTLEHEVSLMSLADATSSSVFDPSPPTPSPGEATSSADLLLPLLIFLVVQYNPDRLVSHLLFLQRFRTESLTRGETSYCSTNLQAVIEFLQNVDVAALGLGSGKTLGAGTPLPKGAGGKMRGRVTNVTQELDRFVDSANSQIVNVVDSSYRLIFGAKGLGGKTIEEVRSVLEGSQIIGNVASKARMLRRRATSSPGYRPESKARDDQEDKPQREMKDFVNGEVKAEPTAEARPSIGDRLASISGLRAESRSTSGASTPSTTTSPPPARRVSLSAAPPLPPRRTSTVEPVLPLQRFLECDASDLRLGEVELLLMDYRRLAGLLTRGPDS